jgi:hypothetical protein
VAFSRAKGLVIRSSLHDTGRAEGVESVARESGRIDGPDEGDGTDSGGKLDGGGGCDEVRSQLCSMVVPVSTHQDHETREGRETHLSAKTMEFGTRRDLTDLIK